MSDPESRRPTAVPSTAERAYLRAGLGQPGGKLPLFDGQGRRIDPELVRACLKRGWAERWFSNPLAPNWLVCRLTRLGREAAGQDQGADGG